MRIGSIVDLPQQRGEWATVKDEFDNPYTTHISQLPEDAEVKDKVSFNYAFEVNLSQAPNLAGNVKPR